MLKCNSPQLIASGGWGRGEGLIKGRVTGSLCSSEYGNTSWTWYVFLRGEVEYKGGRVDLGRMGSKCDGVY